MRLLRLILEKYGHFADKTLIFPDDVPLCMVLGRNEAGKSTSLAALADLLFGFPTRASYHFRHPSAALRVGGSLRRSDGEEVEARRRRGNDNTLLDAQDRPLGNGVLLTYLGGVGRAEFERVFALDQNRLREGGEAMLKDDGAVGGVLLRASEGLKDAVGAQRRLTARLDRLHRAKRNQGTETARLEAALKDHRAKLRSAQLSAEEWEKAEAEAREANGVLAHLRDERRELERRSAHLQRILQTKPILGRIDAAVGELAPLGDLPELDADFGERWTGMRTELAKRQDRLEAALAELARVAEELRAEPDPDPILQASEDVAAVSEQRGAVVKARVERPNRESELRDAQAALERIAREVGSADPATLCAQMPNALARKELVELAKLGADVSTRLELARSKLRRAEAESDRLAKDGSAHPALGVEQDQVIVLRRRFEAVRGLADDLQQADVVRAQCEAIEKRLDAGLASLLGWDGTLEALLASPAPLRERVEHEEQGWRERSDRCSKLTERRRELEGDLDHATQAIEEAKAGTAVPTLDAVLEARRRRDGVWRRIRRRFVEDWYEVDAEPGVMPPDPSPADTYEELVARADEVIDRKERESQRVARHAQAVAAQESAKRRLEALGTELATLEAETLAASESWRALWVGCGVEVRPPREMLAWLGRRDELAALAEERGRAMRALAETRARAEAGRASLTGLAAAAGLAPEPDRPLQDGLFKLETRIEEMEQLAQRHAERRGAVEQAQRTAEEARRETADASAEIERWNASWKEVLARIGLPGQATPSGAQAALELFAEASVQDTIRAAADRRLAAIAGEAASFADTVAGILARLGDTGKAERIQRAELDAVDASRDLEARLNRAGESQARRAKLEQDREERRQQAAELRSDLSAFEVEIRLMRDTARASIDDEVGPIVRKVGERVALRRRLADLRDELLAAGGGLDEAALRVEAAQEAADELAAERDQLQHRRTTLADELETAVRRETKAKDALLELEQRTGADVAAQEVAALVAELGEVAAEWARLRAAYLILSRATECYRERQQDPLLAKAERYLDRLTRGSCAGFAVEFDDRDAPHLAVRRPTGEALSLAGLSEGTRDQLWLALRLAAVELHAERSEPLPFVGDDILVNFDDERAAAGLEALADLGARCQVLLFTHHPHLAALARAHLGTRVGFVELTP